MSTMRSLKRQSVYGPMWKNRNQRIRIPQHKVTLRERVTAFIASLPLIRRFT